MCVDQDGLVGRGGGTCVMGGVDMYICTYCTYTGNDKVGT